MKRIRTRSQWLLACALLSAGWLSAEIEIHFERGHLKTDYSVIDFRYRPDQMLLVDRIVGEIHFSSPVSISAIRSESIYFQDNQRNRHPAVLWVTDPEVQNRSSGVITRLYAAPASDIPGGCRLVVEPIATVPGSPGQESDFMVSSELISRAGENFAEWAVFGGRRSIRFHPELEGRSLRDGGLVVEPKPANMYWSWFEAWQNQPLASEETGPVLHADFEVGATYKLTLAEKARDYSGLPVPKHKQFLTATQAKPVLRWSGTVENDNGDEVLHAHYCSPQQWQLFAVPLEQWFQLGQELEEQRKDRVSLSVEKADAHKLNTLESEFELELVRHGEFSRESNRWKLPSNVLAEVASGQRYLLKATASGNGVVLADYALVRAEAPWVVATMETGNEATYFVVDRATLEPVPDLLVQGLTNANRITQTERTDASGLCRLGLPPALAGVVISDGSASMFHVMDGDEDPFADDDDYSKDVRMHKGVVVSSRSVYRPGDRLRWRGYVRERDGNGLRVPKAKTLRWVLTGDSVAASGEFELDEHGNFSGDWLIPEDTIHRGLRLQLEGVEETTAPRWQIAHFRKAAFEVKLGEPRYNRTSQELVVPLDANTLSGLAARETQLQGIARLSGSNTERMLISAYENPQIDLPHRFEQNFSADQMIDLRATDNEIRLPLADDIVDKYQVIHLDLELVARSSTTEQRAVHKTLRFYPHGSAFTLDLEAGAGPTPRAKIGVNPVRDSGGHIGARVELIVFRSETAPGLFLKRIDDTPIHLREDRVELSTVLKARCSVGESLEFDCREQGRYLVAARFVDQKDLPARYFEFFRLNPWMPDERVKLPPTITAPETPVAVGARASFLLSKEWSDAPVLVAVASSHSVRHLVARALDKRLTFPVLREDYPVAKVTLLQPASNGSLLSAQAVLKIVEDRRLKVVAALESGTTMPGDKMNGSVAVRLQDQAVQGANVTVIALDEAFLKEDPFWAKDSFHDWMYRDPYRRFVGVSVPYLCSYEFHDPGELHNDWFGWPAAYESYSLSDGPFGEPSVHESMRPAVIRRDFVPEGFWLDELTTDSEGLVRFEVSAPESLTQYRLLVWAATPDAFGQDLEQQFVVSQPVQIESALPEFVRQGDELDMKFLVRTEGETDRTIALNVEASTGLSLLTEGNQEAVVPADGETPFVTRARVGENSDLATIVVRALEKGGAGNGDAMERNLPVLPDRLLVSQSHSGRIRGEGPLVLKEILPDSWKDREGSLRLSLSRHPGFDQIQALPLIMHYPHGCMEQKMTQYLSAFVFSDALAQIPGAMSELDYYKNSVLSWILEIGEGIQYWPNEFGPTPNVPFLAGSAFWLVHMAQKEGWLDALADFEDYTPRFDDLSVASDVKPGPDDLAMNAFVFAMCGQADQVPFDRLLEQKEKLSTDARILLAMALRKTSQSKHREAARVLMNQARKIDTVFDPNRFSSATRTECMRVLGNHLVFGERHAQARNDKDRLRGILRSTRALNTQESFWALLAWKNLYGVFEGEAFPEEGVLPVPARRSASGLSLEWDPIILEKASDFELRGPWQTDDIWVMNARIEAGEESLSNLRNGIRIERKLLNLSDARRTGSAEAPLRVGDRVAVVISVSCDKQRYYLALTDSLPACFSADQEDILTMGLDFVEGGEWENLREEDFRRVRKDHVTLFANEMGVETDIYAYPATVVAGGSFAWPAGKVECMYDSAATGASRPFRLEVRSR